MRKVIQLNVEDVMPSATDVLESQNMAGRTNVPERIHKLLDSALELYRNLAKPVGVMEDLPIADFQAIYDANEENSPECPFPGLVLLADALALFAATMGSALATRSSELFKEGGAALGYMLDAVNTCGAERLGRQMGLEFLKQLPEELRRSRKLKVQYYCPGHCGWQLSGQDQLFAALHPEEIGIRLNASWAMQPVKSISGILVVGDIDIHRFQSVFSFCKLCKEHKCIPRLKALELDPN
jgi:hypothetical protein